MVEIKYTDDELWDRIEQAVESVKIRMRRATTALESAAIPYALVGGNAVQLWVAQVDESAIRNTPDVDIVVNRSDLAKVINELTTAGFIHRHSPGMELFLDGPEGRERDAVHVVFAGEKAREKHQEAVPSLDNCILMQNIRTFNLESLVRMKLGEGRLKDLVHVRDMIDVGLVDESWLPRFPTEIRARLQHLLDTPDG